MEGKDDNKKFKRKNSEGRKLTLQESLNPIRNNQLIGLQKHSLTNLDNPLSFLEEKK